MSSHCKHNELTCLPSKTYKAAGYVPRSSLQLHGASVPRPPKAPAYILKAEDFPQYTSTSPAPLVLPGDELFYDAEYPEQDFNEWTKLAGSGFAGPRRKKLYVVPPPRLQKEVTFMKKWAENSATGRRRPLKQPSTKDIGDYLRAFYAGLEVQILPDSTLKFGKWSDEPKDIMLQTETEGIQIRSRKCKDGTLPKQLNLNDLLDVAISILPEDALALIMLVDQDMYEDEDDDFCCGRAFGGSHVCVVSSARYHPWLDELQDIDREHSWPASHCRAFVEQYCNDNPLEPPVKRPKKSKRGDKRPLPEGQEMIEPPNDDSPLKAAVEAYATVKFDTAKSLESLWLWRVCRTASHELGHCLGIDHCVYYACIMQGTASAAEDTRQPPYLCPVDDAKIRSMIAQRGTGVARPFLHGHHISVQGFSPQERALLDICIRHRDGGAFVAYEAWLEARLRQSEKTDR